MFYSVSRYIRDESGHVNGLETFAGYQCSAEVTPMLVDDCPDGVCVQLATKGGNYCNLFLTRAELDRLVSMLPCGKAPPEVEPKPEPVASPSPNGRTGNPAAGVISNDDLCLNDFADELPKRS